MATLDIGFKAVYVGVNEDWPGFKWRCHLTYLCATREGACELAVKRSRVPCHDCGAS